MRSCLGDTQSKLTRAANFITRQLTENSRLSPKDRPTAGIEMCCDIPSVLVLRIMKKSDLLLALQQEIARHDLSNFTDERNCVVVPGCPTCKKRLGTVAQFIAHINDDVLPPLLDRLSGTID